jgi:hypothetical protein
MSLRPLRILLSLVQDGKPQVRVGRLVMALGRPQKCPPSTLTSP